MVRALRSRLSLTLLTRFTLTGLTVTILIGLGLAWAVGRELERSALEQEAASAADEVTLTLDPLFDRADFAGPLSPSRYALIDDRLRERIVSTHIVRVKIWNTTGLVVYSDDPAIIGQTQPVADELDEALHGQVATDITDLTKEENQTLRGLYDRLMEIYVPIHLGGRDVVGAYEIYHDLSVVTPRIGAIQRYLWISLGGGFGILYIALFGLVARASRDLRRQNEELARLEARREIDRLQSEFVSVVSHEVRTPLTAMLGFSELLLDRSTSEPERRQWTEAIHDGAGRLMHLVDELLDLTRIEEGGIALRRRPVDIGAAIETAVGSVRAQNTTHEFVVRGTDRLPQVLADAEKVVQILTNLVSNAVKYSPDGGRVTLATRASGDVVQISVTDEGLGIPAHELPRLFGRFHRVEDDARQEIPGTGLGLYITKQLVDLHGGRIWAESAGPGRGSTFILELPIAPVEQLSA